MGTMKNTTHFSLMESQGSDPSIAIPAKLITAAECFEKKEQAWFVTSKVPTDLSIQVGDITFYAHKYPLVARSGYINRLDLQMSSKLKFGNDVKLDNFPGGAETFEIILKFCYGLPVDLTATNVAPLRCASEFLEMTEEFEDGNLISKTEAFLTFIVLSSWKNSITVLKSSESLSPWVEYLQIIRRCCDSIAWHASRENLANEEFTTDDKKWLFDEVSTLHIDHFVRIITATRAKGAKPEVIGACIMHYAKKWWCGMGLELGDHGQQRAGRHKLQLSILSGKRQERSPCYNKEQRVVESLLSILPPEREAVSCKFLLQMLNIATVYSATPALISELEKRIGMVLKDANVNDLLIPNYKGGDEDKHSQSPPSGDCTMYDIGTVQRILEYFLMHEQQRQQQHFGNSHIGKLLDNYLAEIARDPNLTISKFQVLAEALPPGARTCDDGLYRAIDTFLKTHPSITEHSRRRLCKLMDCDNLSHDACMHAAQNDRLPLRTIIQFAVIWKVKHCDLPSVPKNSDKSKFMNCISSYHDGKKVTRILLTLGLPPSEPVNNNENTRNTHVHRINKVLFSEQLKMRVAIQEKKPVPNEMIKQERHGSSAEKEIETTKAELGMVKTMLEELKRDYSELQQVFEKLNTKQKSTSSWGYGWKKFKNSFLRRKNEK